MSPWESSPRVMLFVFFAPIVAIVCGHLALSHGKSVQTKRQKRITIGGLCLGYAGILAILSYPILNHQHPHFEASAVGSLRTLNVATHGFAAVHGRFPVDLSELACAHDIQNYEWCIDGVLANGIKSAYRFTYTLQRRNENSQTEHYEIHADPTKATPFTRYHFFMDETGAIRYEPNKPATVTSAPLG